MLQKILLVVFLPLIILCFQSFTTRSNDEFYTTQKLETTLVHIDSDWSLKEEVDSSIIPDEIISESSAGMVVFPHLYHYEDEEIECVDCHHEMNAEDIEIPHEEYFEEFWINCKDCHTSRINGENFAHPCSYCHNSQPSNIADEMISKKVAIHKNCWECHEVGTGLEASESCEVCHIKE